MGAAKKRMECRLVGGPFSDLVISEGPSVKTIALDTEGHPANKFKKGGFILYRRAVPEVRNREGQVEFYYETSEGVRIE